VLLVLTFVWYGTPAMPLGTMGMVTCMAGSYLVMRVGGQRWLRRELAEYRRSVEDD